jgi:hypothetical protein
MIVSNIARKSIQTSLIPCFRFASTSNSHLETITKEFLNVLETRKSWDDLKHFYHPKVEQTEYPNAITKVTAVRGFTDLQQASEKGSKVLMKEEYIVKKIYSFENAVILEAIW